MCRVVFYRVVSCCVLSCRVVSCHSRLCVRLHEGVLCSHLDLVFFQMMLEESVSEANGIEVPPCVF